MLYSDKSQLIDQFRNEGFYASSVHLPNNLYSVFGERKNLKGITEFFSKFIALPCGWWFNK
jgi:perosamine synthetase